MDKDSLQKYFFIGLLFISTALVFFIFLPFLEVIVLSAIFAIVLSPLQKRLSRRLGGRNGLSAFILVLCFMVTVLTPSVFLTFKLLDESKSIYAQLTNNSEIDYVQKISNAIEKPIQKFSPEFSINVGELASIGADWITGHLTTILSSVFNIITDIVLIFFSLFFFLRDGEKFKGILMDLSPLNDKYDEQISLKVKQTVNTTFVSVLLIAIIQGVLSGFGMWIFGIPNPTLWGAVSAVASLVPGLGTTITFVPAIIYSYFSGNIPHMLGLILWWVLGVSLIDNLLSPYIYSRSVEIHQLIMLFAVLGGLAFFGPIGFIFGPIVVAVFFVLIDIYQDLILNAKSL
ncbi:MAG: hypothetical protein AB201_01880 [Parcubacteria bacterium C7867-006]|nr:MAG: hypothetical protein AB201_01880 [Parcubacteria bacterium C7867-006]